jgi:hypothetical protein
VMARPWVVDSLPPTIIKSRPTMDEVWEQHDQRSKLLDHHI